MFSHSKIFISLITLIKYLVIMNAKEKKVSVYISHEILNLVQRHSVLVLGVVQES